MSNAEPLCADRTYERLEELYSSYNKREYVSPDPLEFLYRYDSHADREVAGLIASSLAYGRVASILSSVGKILGALGDHPADALASMKKNDIARRLSGFRHRFCGDEEMTAFLRGIGRVLVGYGSLENLFCSAGAPGSPGTITERMEHFSRTILEYAGMESSHLIPCPSKGSACKRMALYIRWMIREDDVDPGGWECAKPADIILPLDTHMFRIARGLGFVTRKCADGKSAIQATEGFRRLNPADPVKYDFALTRFGIRTGLSVDELLASLTCP